VALRALTATDHGPVFDWTPIRWACGSSRSSLPTTCSRVALHVLAMTDVADVWVDGRRRVVDGELVGSDLAELVAASRPLAAELVTRAGLEGLSRLAR
jgi:hypothetical protein